MTQEGFNSYWSRGQEILKERAAGYDLVVLRMPDGLVDAREGFAACLVGKAGTFAGSFLLYRSGRGVALKGRWCSPSGTWYSFVRELDPDRALDELIAFVRRVVEKEDGFEAIAEFAARRIQ